MNNKVDVPALWSEQMGAVVAKQNELAANAFATDQALPELREAYRVERRFWNEGGPQSFSVRDESVNTPFGTVPVRMYRPSSAETLPVIVYLHGGGWILGDLDTHDRVTRALAAETGAAVLAVDYTLSPEAKFPQAIREAAAVVQEIRANPEKWGIDAEDVSLAGDSGGAHLSFGTYLWLRDELGDTRALRTLLLFYGYYGLRDSASFRLYGGEWDGLTEEDFAYFIAQYTADPEDMRSPYIDVLSANLDADVPPSFVISAGLDPLLDDSRALAEVLTAKGVSVEYQEIPGVLHGFIHHSRMLDATLQVLADAGKFYKANGPQAAAKSN